jgi:hypothetical protein
VGSDDVGGFMFKIEKSGFVKGIISFYFWAHVLKYQAEPMGQLTAR